MSQTSQKVRVNAEAVRRAVALLAKLNQIPFPDIEWIDKGVPLRFSQEEMTNWLCSGRDNSEFVDRVIDDHDDDGEGDLSELTGVNWPSGGNSRGLLDWAKM